MGKMFVEKQLELMKKLVYVSAYINSVHQPHLAEMRFKIFVLLDL